VLVQKIAEMQKQFKVANISAAREKRYGVIVDDGLRIVINQCPCDVQTKHFGYRGVGCRQNRNPILVFMPHRLPRRARRHARAAIASSGGLPLLDGNDLRTAGAGAPRGHVQR